MSIEDRLRESLRRAAGPTDPSERAWTSIEHGVERRRRRANGIRAVGGAVVVVAFVGVLTWAALALRGRRTEVGHRGSTLRVTNVKVLASGPDRGPGAAKLYGTLINDGPRSTGAAVSCSL